MSGIEGRDALNGAVHNFEELVRILEDAVTRAERVNDGELVARLTEAKSAAEHSSRLLEELRGNQSSNAQTTTASPRADPAADRSAKGRKVY